MISEVITKLASFLSSSCLITLTISFRTRFNCCGNSGHSFVAPDHKMMRFLIFQICKKRIIILLLGSATHIRSIQGLTKLHRVYFCKVLMKVKHETVVRDQKQAVYRVLSQICRTYFIFIF